MKKIKQKIKNISPANNPTIFFTMVTAMAIILFWVSLGIPGAEAHTISIGMLHISLISGIFTILFQMDDIKIKKKNEKLN